MDMGGGDEMDLKAWAQQTYNL